MHEKRSFAKPSDSVPWKGGLQKTKPKQPQKLGRVCKSEMAWALPWFSSQYEDEDGDNDLQPTGVELLLETVCSVKEKTMTEEVTLIDHW